MNRRSRTFTVVAGTAGAVVLLAGPASAHFCTNTARSDTANAALAKGSKGWIVPSRDLGSLLGVPCQDGHDHLVEALEDAGVDAGMPILAHAVLAGGVQRQIFEEEGRKDALPKPIANTDFAAFGAVEAALPAAMALCGD